MNKPKIPHDLVLFILIVVLVRTERSAESGFNRVIFCPSDISHIIIVHVRSWWKVWESGRNGRGHARDNWLSWSLAVSGLERDDTGMGANVTRHRLGQSSHFEFVAQEDERRDLANTAHMSECP